MAVRYPIPIEPKAGSGLKANWGDQLIRSIGALRPVQAPGVFITKSTYGTSMRFTNAAKTYPVRTSVLKPFTVRWYGEETGGQWQIYMPLGSATITQHTLDGAQSSVYIPKNDRAEDKDGNEIPGWYKIDDPEDGVEDVEYEDEDYEYRYWTVWALMKPWARLVFTAMPEKYKEDNKEAFLWEEPVGTITIRTPKEKKGEEGDGKPQKIGSDGTDEKIRKSWDASVAFSVQYTFDPEDAVKSDAIPSAEVVNNTVGVGRAQLFAEDFELPQGWGTDGERHDVWMRINHSSTSFSLELDKDLDTGSGDSGEDETRSDDNKTMRRILVLENLVVTTDDRAGIPVQAFYTSPEEQDTDDADGSGGGGDGQQ